MNKTIVFDIDDTIAVLRHFVVSEIQKQIDYPIDINDVTSIVVSEAFPHVSWSKIEKTIIESQILLDLPVEINAHNVLNKIKAMGYNIAIVTARGYHPNGYDITKEWLTNNDLPFDDIFCVDHKIPKSKVISTLGTVELYIDDHAGHVHSCHGLDNVNHKVIISRPWNKSYEHQDVIKIASLDDILKIIK